MENEEDNDSKIEKPPANIVFCLDTREVNVREISERALDTYSDVRIYIYTQKSTIGESTQ